LNNTYSRSKTILTRLQHRLRFILAALCILPAALAPGAGWNDSKAGNPVLPGYFADPCCRKFGDTYYLYVTPDGWGVGEGPVVIWTSKDFVHWTSNKSNWPTTRQKWAPSVVYRNSKYYMYTQVPCQVWLATANTPLGPWTNAMPKGGQLFFSVNGNIPTDVGSRPVFRESNLNTWKYIAVVYDAAAKNVKFYANGALLSQTSYSVAVPAGLVGGIKLGSRDGGERWFSGKLDDFRIYGRALTGTEVGSLYKAVSESGVEPRQAQEQKAK